MNEKSHLIDTTYHKIKTNHYLCTRKLMLVAYGKEHDGYKVTEKIG